MIIQEQSLGSDHKENLTNKWSSGHAMQLRAMLKSIACPTNHKMPLKKLKWEVKDN